MVGLGLFLSSSNVLGSSFKLIAPFANSLYILAISRTNPIPLPEGNSICRISFVLKLACANRFFESTMLLLVNDTGFMKENNKLLGKLRKFLNKSKTELIPLIFATLVLSIDSGKPI